ncbi:protein YrbN [Escherichia coli]
MLDQFYYELCRCTINFEAHVLHG